MNPTGVLTAVGNTPLVHLKRISEDTGQEVYAKLEGCNPGGSSKDRPAVEMIHDAISRGRIRAGGVVVESSSGNMAIGLAQACIQFGLQLICIVDPKTSQQNLKILQAYGARIDLVTQTDPATGEFLPARIHRVRELLELFPGAFWPNQYANRANSKAHQRTMAEIANGVGGAISYLFCATSTCGTLRGCSEFVRERGLGTIIYAVDAVGSVIFSPQICKRLIPGHGAAIRPELYEDCLAHHSVLIADLETVIGCRYLVRREGILAGGSSGAVLSALYRCYRELTPNSICVLIFPDRGERYLDTIYCDQWVAEHFGVAARDRLAGCELDSALKQLPATKKPENLSSTSTGQSETNLAHSTLPGEPSEDLQYSN